jgi:hypothetical protein
MVRRTCALVPQLASHLLHLYLRDSSVRWFFVHQWVPDLLGDYFCHLAVNFGTILLCAATLLEQWFPELLEAYFCHLVVNFGTILLCSASLLNQWFPKLLGAFCHLVVNFGTILLCAASLLEQRFPELLGAEASSELSGGRPHPQSCPCNLIQLRVVSSPLKNV